MLHKATWVAVFDMMEVTGAPFAYFAGKGVFGMLTDTKQWHKHLDAGVYAVGRGAFLLNH